MPLIQRHYWAAYCSDCKEQSSLLKFRYLHVRMADRFFWWFCLASKAELSARSNRHSNILVLVAAEGCKKVKLIIARIIGMSPGNLDCR